MQNTTNTLLPVLPLRNGVVFPQMVVTLRIETSEGKTALDASENAQGRMLLVPRVEGRYASVGTIAEIHSDDGDGNIVIEGVARARVGSGSTDESGALWVEAEEYPETEIIDEELDALVEEYRAVLAAVMDHRGVGRMAERVLDVDNPSRLADLAAGPR